MEIHIRPSTSASGKTMLDVQNLGWGPRGQPDILSDINFSVPEGQVLAICGANGAGKSTLLRALYRFQRPRRGRVLLQGDDVWQLSPRAAAQCIAAVVQEQPTDFPLTAREVVALGRIPHRFGISGKVAEHDEAVNQVLQRLHLTHLSNQAFNTLSGGERQRVLIGRALAQQPALLVLDEPTNHLDIRHQLEILTLIRQLRLTVVMTVHDLRLASEYADQVLMLANGKLTAHGKPQQVLNDATIAQAFGVRTTVMQTASGQHLAFSL